MSNQIDYKALAETLMIERLVTNVHPTGIVSLVSDTFDLWKVLTVALPKLKDKIMARDGGPESLDKVVIRPDSGDPVDILCGTYVADSIIPAYKPEQKGVVELLWEIFGGTVNEQGYKVLDPHIGAIYGDSITPERCTQICERLKAKGFASTNVVFGIGSYTYQYLTRDSLGFAMKATSVTINGKEQAIFKDPITDDGTKKSAKGRVVVLEDEENGIHYVDASMYNSSELNTLSESDLLQTVFENGKIVRETSLSEVRNRVK